MPALYPDYPCQVCNGAHTLYYLGIGPSPDTSRHYYFTCTKLPVPMRVVGADRWHPVRRKPEGAVEIYRDDAAGQREMPSL
jgi:hypothetical protein